MSRPVESNRVLSYPVKSRLNSVNVASARYSPHVLGSCSKSSSSFNLGSRLAGCAANQIKYSRSMAMTSATDFPLYLPNQNFSSSPLGATFESASSKLPLARARRPRSRSLYFDQSSRGISAFPCRIPIRLIRFVQTSRTSIASLHRFQIRLAPRTPSSPKTVEAGTNFPTWKARATSVSRVVSTVIFCN